MKGSANSAKRVAILAVYSAFAMILSYVESMIPILIGIPGVKLGLANLVIVLTLYQMSYADGLIVNIVRIIATGFLFGNLFGIAFSLSGGIVSYMVMCLFKRSGFHILTAAVAGGISHNMGQLLAAYFLVSNQAVWYYLPVLMVAGFVTGLVIGILSSVINDRLGYRWNRTGSVSE